MTQETAGAEPKRARKGRKEAKAGEAPGEAVAPKRKPRQSPSEKLARLCVVLAAEKKALNPVVLDLREKSSFTDFFVILSGTSDRHVRSIAAGIEEGLAGGGVRALGLEGLPAAQWVLVDLGDVVVHVFYSSIRLFYDLESLWVDAPRLKLAAPAGAARSTRKRKKAKDGAGPTIGQDEEGAEVGQSGEGGPDPKDEKSGE